MTFSLKLVSQLMLGPKSATLRTILADTRKLPLEELDLSGFLRRFCNVWNRGNTVALHRAINAL